MLKGFLIFCAIIIGIPFAVVMLLNTVLVLAFLAGVS